MLGTALVPLHYRLLLHNKATSESNMSAAHVSLYFTQAATKDGDDLTEGKNPLGNRLYRYELVNNRLVEPELLAEFACQSWRHRLRRQDYDRTG